MLYCDVCGYLFHAIALHATGWSMFCTMKGKMWVRALLYAGLVSICSAFRLIHPVSQSPTRLNLMNSGSLKVAYQGEPGAYSEKASKEMLGNSITTVNYPSFEDAFRAVASRDVDFAVVPIENSLGGSIHNNYDLLLRYDLHIVAEHEFRVEHCLLALPGTVKQNIKTVLSHSQALAQCEKYVMSLGATAQPVYDTAGAAKYIRENNLLDTAAIASDLAAVTYGLEVLEKNVEDHEINYTRFLLLARTPVSALLAPNMASKTSIVFVVPNQAGALYKALACFSLRDIDFCKIESRPTSVDLLQQLQFQAAVSRARMIPTSPGGTGASDAAARELPRFRYTFYLDYLASEYDDRSQNALLHLREQSEYMRVLGSYPTGSVLVGPVLDAVRAMDAVASGRTAVAGQLVTTANVRTTGSNTAMARHNPHATKPLKIGIIGFGKFGQFIAKTFVRQGQEVHCVDQSDRSAEAKSLGCAFYPLFDLSAFLKADLDVVLLSVSIISFEGVLRNLPRELLANKLVVDVLSVKAHAKATMLEVLPTSSDILCTHPMFGPESGRQGWQGLPFLYDQVRIADAPRCARFLSLWESERCKMIEMSCEQHDAYAANSQFITHLTGRILWEQNLAPTPIDTRGFQTVLQLVENTCKDSFDLFFGLYFYNQHAPQQLQNIREALAKVERQLAAKEAYLRGRAEASAEASVDQRARLLEECKSIIKEVLTECAVSPLPPPSVDIEDK